jgi:hypothetical protein
MAERKETMILSAVGNTPILPSAEMKKNDDYLI